MRSKRAKERLQCGADLFSMLRPADSGTTKDGDGGPVSALPHSALPGPFNCLMRQHARPRPISCPVAILTYFDLIGPVLTYSEKNSEATRTERQRTTNQGGGVSAKCANASWW